MTTTNSWTAEYTTLEGDHTETYISVRWNRPDGDGVEFVLDPTAVDTLVMSDDIKLDDVEIERLVAAELQSHGFYVEEWTEGVPEGPVFVESDTDHENPMTVLRYSAIAYKERAPR